MSAGVSIVGLDRLLAGAEPAGVDEVRALVAELLRPVPTERSLQPAERAARPAPRAELLEDRMIWRARVHRARFRVENEERSFILKRLPLDRAHREQLAVRQWLPRLGLETHGSPLLGVAAARQGECIWHVYADLGPHTLDKRTPEPCQVAAAVELLAQLHTRAATCAFLGECREFGVDLGLHFLATGIADAIRALEGILRLDAEVDAGQRDLCERLRQRLVGLRAEEPERTRLVAAQGGPETLLHGDLWTCNIFVLTDAATPVHVRFIDWDHAGVGYASYDLSALLLRFPPHARGTVLATYAAAIAPAGWRLPERETLNALFETAEIARLVSAVLWPALAFHASRPQWAADRLAEVDSWFEQLQPVLAGGT